MLEKASSYSNHREFPPIIYKILDTYKYWYLCTPHIPKAARYTLAVRIDNIFIDIMELTLDASILAGNKKAHYISKASEKLDLLKFLLMLLWEVKAIDNKKYIVLSEDLGAFGRMLGGWGRSLKSSINTLISKDK